MLNIFTGKCLLLEKVGTEKIKLHLLLEKLVTREWVGLTWLRIGQWRGFCPRLWLTWPRIGHSDVYSVRDLFQSDKVTCFPSEILGLHDPESDTMTLCLSEIYSNRTQWHVFCPRYWISWLRIGHSGIVSVRYLFQSDTVTCFLSEVLDLHDSESDTVTSCLSEIYSNRT